MKGRPWWVDKVHADLCVGTYHLSDEGTLKLLLCELIREVRNLRSDDDSSEGMIRGAMGDNKVAWANKKGLSWRARRVLEYIEYLWISDIDEHTLKFYSKRMEDKSGKIPCGPKTISEILEWVAGLRG